jgi:hypothetical protein
LCICIDISMVVLVINISYIWPVQSKSNPPISADSDGPTTAKFAAQLMQVQTW